MERKKSLSKMLFSSVISLLLCVSMLVGTTFAWFTDSVTSGVNTIAAGNLDVELYYQVEGQSDWSKVDSTTNVFMENALWEPGHTEVVKLKIVNEGSLSLKYTLGVSIADEDGSVNKDGNSFLLSDYIKYGFVEGDQNYTREEAVAAVDANALELNATYYSAGVHLLPKTDSNTDNEDILTMVVYMPTTVGNEANHGKGEVVPTILLGIKLFATQYPHEEDSFDETYDTIYTIANYFQYIERYGEAGSYLVIEDFTADDYIFWGYDTDVSLDMNGKTIDAYNQNQFLFITQESLLHLTGNGTANMGKGFLASGEGAELIIDNGTYNMGAAGTTGASYNSFVQTHAKVVINGGTFTSNADNTCLFYASNNGRIEINGGFFENIADKTPDLLSMATNRNSVNRIIIKGGTFVNWNPLEDRMCYTGTWPSNGEAAFRGPWMLIPGGYKVVSETQANGDVWYSVVPA